MTGVPLLWALLYGAGLRLLERAELRVKDLDLERRKLLVRDGNGRKDRITMLPLRLVPPLRDHLTAVRAQHAADVAAGAGWVALPNALDRKVPNAGREWPWPWVFPATRPYRDRETGQLRRHQGAPRPPRREHDDDLTHVLNRGRLTVRSPSTAPWVRD
ncbi:hypothetical protein WMF38_25070 [Sorangium sp. So ce118]